MLHIVTDLENTNWLRYILNEFKRINLARFDFQIHPLENVNSLQGNTIYYTTDYVANICIPNRSGIKPVGKLEKTDSKLAIIEGSSVKDKRFAFAYDIFWNAFVFLSRLEEFQCEKHGKKINSYTRNHPRVDRSTFDIPIVNYLFDDFEQWINKNFPKLKFGQKQRPEIELSHDVDYIKKTHQLRLKQTAFNIFNIIRLAKNPAEAVAKAKKAFEFLLFTPSYWCFDFWRDLEKAFNKRSIFYVYVKTPGSSWRSRFINPSYEITKDIRLQNQLKKLIDDEFEIGLHGSYGSATNDSLLAQEKSLLEEILNKEVIKVRQHWLRYEEKITPILHNKYFKYDSSLGWNDRMGFRSGCASRYRPFNHEAQEPFEYMVTPQVIMDSHIFDYGIKNINHQIQKSLSILLNLQHVKSAHISISWHQRVSSKDYQWHNVYADILKKLEMA